MTNYVFGTEKPEVLDEGWWSAVLQEESYLLGTQQSSTPLTAPNAVADWQRARELYETDEPIELTVTGYNRGGLLVHFNSLQGFIPASHLLNFPLHLPEKNRLQMLANRVGQRLYTKVIEYNPAKARVVFSERAALSGPGSRQSVLRQLKPGAVVSGVVTNVCDFGAFVDLGGIEGLIHVSEVSWNRVTHPRDVLACNQTVQVVVMEVQPEQRRVALSLKRVQPDPWANLDKRYTVGQMVEGVVTNVVNFGAFVSLEEGLEGLIHVSELADGHFLHPRSIVHEGERVQACVVTVDPNGRRLGLSLRRLPITPVANYPAATIH